MGKVVILMGSPRLSGSTAALCQQIAAGAAAHHSVDVIPVSTFRVGGCTGCNACFHTPEHTCVQQDDMTAQLYDRLRAADVLVIATPLYFYGVSAQLKLVIDRLHAPIRNTFSVKKLALVSVAGNDDPSIFHSLMEMYHTTRNYFHLEDGGVLTVPGVRTRAQLEGHPALDAAYELGQRL
jgi:multimeric flavodoxin WrbA